MERIEGDWRTAGLDSKRVAMLGYVEKLTTSPGDMTQSDVEALREAAFSDRDILDICEVTAYYAYVNRVADGLGVQIETWLDDN
ncbi:MAG: peroxidase [Acidimicrobiia bacterium]